MKKWCSVFVFVVLIVFLVSACRGSDNQKTEEYCYKINSIIKDKEFSTAKITDGTILLYDNEDVCIEELPFEDYQTKPQIGVVLKDGAMIRFVLYGAVDDEEGILFINDASNGLLDGIKSIKRIGGNSYFYSTSE